MTTLRSWLIAAPLLLASAAASACPLSAPDVIRADGFEACARAQSSFRRLTADLEISGTAPTVVLAHSFTLNAPTRVLAVADGRHFPVDAPAAALRIRFDGDESQSSVSLMDWGSSQRPVMHGFNVIADAVLDAGTHTVDLAFVVTPLGVGLWVGNQRLTPEGVTTNNQRNCSMPTASMSSNA